VYVDVKAYFDLHISISEFGSNHELTFTCVRSVTELVSQKICVYVMSHFHTNTFTVA
jgi:hypothetical protein